MFVDALLVIASSRYHPCLDLRNIMLCVQSQSSALTVTVELNQISYTQLVKQPSLEAHCLLCLLKVPLTSISSPPTPEDP